MRYFTIGYESQKWVFIFHFISIYHIALGIKIRPDAPNIEVLLPGGFLRLGRQAPADVGLLYTKKYWGGIVRRMVPFGPSVSSSSAVR